MRYSLFSFCVSLTIVCVGAQLGSMDVESDGCRSLPCIRESSGQTRRPFSCRACDKRRSSSFENQSAKLGKERFLHVRAFPLPPALPSEASAACAPFLKELCSIGTQAEAVLAGRGASKSCTFDPALLAEKVDEAESFLKDGTRSRSRRSWSVSEILTEDQRGTFAPLLACVYRSRFDWGGGKRVPKRSFRGARSGMREGVVWDRFHVSLLRDFSPIDKKAYKENDFLGHARVADCKEIYEQIEYLESTVHRNITHLQHFYSKVFEERIAALREEGSEDKRACAKELEKVSAQILEPLSRCNFAKCWEECRFVRNCGILDLECDATGTCSFTFSDRIAEEQWLFSSERESRPSHYQESEHELRERDILAVLNHVSTAEEEGWLIRLALLSVEALASRLYDEVEAWRSEARGREGHNCVCFRTCVFCVRRAERGGGLLAMRCLSRHVLRLTAQALCRDAGDRRKYLVAVLPLVRGIGTIFSKKAITMAGRGELKRSGLLDRELLLLEKELPADHYALAPGAVFAGELLSIWSQLIVMRLADSLQLVSAEQKAKRSRSVHYRRDRQGSRARETSAHAGFHASARPFM